MTKQNEIIFNLNATEKIVINLADPLNEIHCCYDTNIYFKSGKNNYLLSSDTLRESMHVLHSLLQKALLCELPLPTSLACDGSQKDIGYLYNEYCQTLYYEEVENKGQFAYKKSKEGENYWVGYDYALWCHDFQSWLYNDTHGDIILALTPLYTIMCEEGKETEHILAYQEWIQRYKPFLIRKVSRNTAEKWLKQSHEILATIEANIKRLIAENKF